ncbi:superoxide dismutase [Malassezia cuniculi]|uniref:Superoxide dismutase n=1 Tax=Malassezia cuniculi TaxID=948313 RepID=A0AAF0EQV8_9BASI|nr:superoxide dismutase [Malassezia cuniculi]
MHMLAKSARSALRVLPAQRRALHQLPPLPSAIAEGCDPFLSKRTTSLLWNQWQAGLLQRLNEEVKGTPHATESVVETVVNTARDRSSVIAYSYASLALNNSFFLSGLMPGAAQPNPEYPQPSSDSDAKFFGKTLATAIAEQYGSLPQLKLAFSSAAMGMFSSGFVWLVKDEHGRLGIVPTYGTGTVLVQQRQQRGPSDLVAGVQDGSGGAEGEAPAQNAGLASGAPTNRFDSLAHGSAAGAIGHNLYPLLCVSVFEHAWLGDYGFWGKERYLERFWDAVNWTRAEHLWGTDRV